MVDKEKKRFHEMAEKDKQRYEAEMQNYVPPKGAVVGRGKKRKQIKDPNAPKRSLWVRSKVNYHIIRYSAYKSMWLQEIMKRIRSIMIVYYALFCRCLGLRSSGSAMTREIRWRHLIPSSEWATSPKSWDESGPMWIPRSSRSTSRWPSGTRLDMNA